MTVDFQSIGPGKVKHVQINVGRLYDLTDIHLNLRIQKGKKDGPILFITAAIHGDEINGIEIIRRLLQQKALKNLCGTLITVPIVNIFGFNNRSRYLPDRRDLNRCFPGSSTGSLAARLAHTLMTEVVLKSTCGIDLHTGAVHRNNLPQIRAHLDNSKTNKLARAFGAPVILNSTFRDGSLRFAAHERNIPILLFEGGEALRFDDKVTKVGVRGILSVMEKMKMLPEGTVGSGLISDEAYVAKNSFWLRAPESGLAKGIKKLGAYVEAGDLLAFITSPYGDSKVALRAPHSGIIIGASALPLVTKGDAMYHIATFDENLDDVRESLETYEDEFLDGHMPSII
ncbi:MAG: succinylglutamate desuccinylase/aspartoacylase family protein [Bdellovibrionales bacterium]|nr:succinylglutamate desuccinylase/aspartoacylase family protein [Bdellovibrionales bacterium]